MKKFLSAMLVVLMLASLTVCAFAGDSPSQDTGGDGGGYYYADAPKATTTNKDKEKAEAEKEEAKAAKTVEEIAAEDEDGEEVAAALGKLPSDATDEMKADFEKIEDALVDAKAALAKDEVAAVPADIKADAADGAKVAAGPAFRAVAAQYPATITIAVDNPEDFVGMMIFQNGKWVKLNATVNDDGTVTFVLDQPAVLSIVSQNVSAA